MLNQSTFCEAWIVTLLDSSFRRIAKSIIFCNAAAGTGFVRTLFERISDVKSGE